MFDTDVVAENGFHFVKWHVKRFNLRYYTTIFCQKKFLTSHLLRAKKIKLLPAAMFDPDVVAENGFHAVKWHVERFNLRYYTTIFCLDAALSGEASDWAAQLGLPAGALRSAVHGFTTPGGADLWLTHDVVFQPRAGVVSGSLQPLLDRYGARLSRNRFGTLVAEVADA